MDPIDRARIQAYHRQRIEAFGEASHRALGWKSPESQRQRFEVMADVADFNDRSVLDVGCGRGDLRGYLGEFYPRLRYSGIDQMPDFLDAASANFGHMPNTTFLLGDFSTAILPQYDYLLICGSLNYKTSQADFTRTTLERLFDCCTVGMAASFLRTMDPDDPVLRAHDPKPILAQCRALGRRVVLRDDYSPDDFSVFVYR